MRGGIEGGDGAGGTPANPNARGIDVVGGGVLTEPTNGFGGVLRCGIYGSKEGAEVGGGASFIGGAIDYEPILDGSTDVAALGKGFTEITNGDRPLVPRDESTAMNEDHGGQV